jgi:hypothetical protein
MDLMPVHDSDTLGLYISIPFCRSKCTYCNFASGVYPASEHVRYVDRVIQDLAAAGDWAARMGLELPRTVDTVYLGGGTPSLLAPALLTQLFAAIRAEFDLEPDAEITVECAPGQIPGETLGTMAAIGVNRVSMGVQSFIDREAQVSGRLHNRAVVEEDVRRLRAAGIPNLNLDLIAGLAGQTPASWDESLTALIESGVPHASIYMLEVDEDSRLGREMLAGGLSYYAEKSPAPTTRSRRCTRGQSRGSRRRVWRSMRSRIFAGRDLRLATTCAIGNDVPTWDWAWMHRPCCARRCRRQTARSAEATFFARPRPMTLAHFSLLLSRGPRGQVLVRGVVSRRRRRGSRRRDSTRKRGFSACASTLVSMWRL